MLQGRGSRALEDAGQGKEANLTAAAAAKCCLDSVPAGRAALLGRKAVMDLLGW